MQGFILIPITATEKCTLILDSTQILTKSVNVGQGHRVMVRS